jgi:hypothetical protein
MPLIDTRAFIESDQIIIEQTPRVSSDTFISTVVARQCDDGHESSYGCLHRL